MPTDSPVWIYDPRGRWPELATALTEHVGPGVRLVADYEAAVLLRLAADDEPRPVVALAEDEAGALAAIAAGADGSLTRADLAAGGLSARIARAAARRRAIALRLARQAAEVGAAAETLEAFGRSVSHDLRAPLRALHGFGQALVEDFGDGLDPLARRYLDRMSAAADRLDDRLTALLALTEAVRRPFEREWLDLGRMADDVMRSRLETSDRAVHWQRDAELMVSGDRRLLLQLVEALLDNALLFSSTRASAHIELRRHGGGFVVRDDGVGFGQGYADNIFHAFSRFHTPEEFPGRGMGLTVARCVVERHGGRIVARGVEDRGAAFGFTLDPAAALPAVDVDTLLPPCAS